MIWSAIWVSVARGAPRARAPAVAGEHALGCPGAQLSITWDRLPGSMLSVAQEHNLALPGIGCPEARSRLPGRTLSVAR